MTRLQKIHKKAKADAFAYGTSKSVYSYPDGKPKQSYKADLKLAYPHRNDWATKQRAAGAACDVFVGTVVRSSGADKDFPSAITKIQDYCKKHPKRWKKLDITEEDKMMSGDIIYQYFTNGKKHVSIYLGEGKVANAHRVLKTYAVIELYSKVIKPKEDCTRFWVYRVKG